MTIRATVDEDACVSSGKCVADAPVVFEFDDDEIARATGSTGDLDRDGLVRIARACPSGAIRLIAGDVEIELD